MRALSRTSELSSFLQTAYRSAPWWLLGAIAVVEIVGHFVIQSRVATDADWGAAADHVRDHWEAGDTLVVAPDWADPTLRLFLGDLIPIEDAGRSDLASATRLWEISLRGHRSSWAPEEPPTERFRFGRIVLSLWNLGASSVVYDLNENIRNATVRRDERECPWRRMRAEGGGLSRGPLTPAERFFCGPEPWLFVAPTVTEDLDLMPRSCIWQHPAGGDGIISTTFEDIPLGERIVLHGGLYYWHERELEHGPVVARVLVDGTEVGRLVHEDGDGWARIEAETRPLGGAERGDVRIEVTAENPHLRSFCWAASIRGPRNPERLIPRRLVSRGQR